MDASDAAELIGEVNENGGADRLRNRAALWIAIVAAVLAIGGLGGGNATDDMIFNNIRASNTWAFYQAKNLRQTFYEVAAAGIEAELTQEGMDPARRAARTARLAEYRATVLRYENEPDSEAPNDPLRGEGKRQLSAQARAFEAARERASEQDGNFDMAEVLLQLALVLGSVAILAVNRMVLLLSVAVGIGGAFLVANGFLLLVALPI